MNLLSDISTFLEQLNIPTETGYFTGAAPDTYVVLVPLPDEYGYHADNSPHVDIQDVRISLYCKGNYISIKNRIVSVLIENGITITSRRYVDYEPETGYYHYNIDVSNYYDMEV